MKNIWNSQIPSITDTAMLQRLWEMKNQEIKGNLITEDPHASQGYYSILLSCFLKNISISSCSIKYFAIV